MAEALDPAVPGWLDALATQVLDESCARGLRLVTAESCTGGLLASFLTDMPGRSHAFERGFVVYTNAAKHELLGVSEEVLRNEGAVSEAAARAMADGALAASQGDLAASITGFAEAGPGPDEPAGRVHFALARRNRDTTHRHEEFGDVGRAKVRLECLRVALEMFRDSMIRPG